MGGALQPARKYLLIIRKGNQTERNLSEVVVKVGDLTSNQRELNLTASERKSETIQRLERMREQLGGLVLNKYCQNKWKYAQGRCYYFSLPSETDTWDGAQVVGPVEKSDIL